MPIARVRPALLRRAAAAAAALAVAGGLAVAPPATAKAAAVKVAANGRPVDYVALGDSYTSSPLTGPNQPGSPPGCLRSTNNYPSLVAARLGVRTVTDVSCSGATTKDFASPQQTQAGTNAPQYDALSPAADLVSVGIGGNDIGFTSVITTCARLTALNATAVPPSPTPCQDFYTSGGSDQLRGRIDALAPTIAGVLDTVRARTAKQTQVRLVGYPAILPEAYVATCAPGIPYTPGDVDYLRGVEKYLNAMLATQAGAASGTSYVDTYTRSIGHDSCQLPAVRWVEPLTPALPAAPVHPNALGQVSSAEAVLSTLG